MSGLSHRNHCWERLNVADFKCAAVKMGFPPGLPLRSLTTWPILSRVGDSAAFVPPSLHRTTKGIVREFNNFLSSRVLGPNWKIGCTAGQAVEAYIAVK